MTKSTVGDRLAPPLQPVAAALASSANSRRSIEALPSPKPSANSKVKTLARSLNGGGSNLPVGSCKQVLWFSFFFDGTGNNLDADLESNKHSNVAKLFRAHRGVENIGGRVPPRSGQTNIYRVYIPGVGTYFRDIGDDGSIFGGGFGMYGDKRIAWALEQMDKLLARHIALANSPGNEIVEINVSAYGFSRGAALARAFINDLLTKRCAKKTASTWIYSAARSRLRVRFLGIFDTVASSGLASSSNNISFIDAAVGQVKSHLWARRHLYANTRPDVLAFAENGTAGADPVPGIFDGHKAFGERMMISLMVEDVRHFVAAHEYRNSFPVDSISYLTNKGGYYKPSHFHEYVYPGVHSDVGGSYRPGEGGRNLDPTTKLGLIPLKAMYDFAVAAQVPLLPVTAFGQESKLDFATHDDLRSDYSYYSSKLNTTERNLGCLFNAHMSLYYQWRFFAIKRRMSGNNTAIVSMNFNAAKFSAEQKKIEAKVAQLELAYEKRSKIATSKILLLSQMPAYLRLSDAGRKTLSRQEEEMREAMEAEKAAHDELMPWKAKLDALPKEVNLASTTRIYDDQLMQDAASILGWIESPTLLSITRGYEISHASLRPHYRALIDAYQNEFVFGKGLQDKRIIDFFDKYVHDSLSAFAKDSTYPSDPRVIYTGGDEKLPYASNSELNGTGNANGLEANELGASVTHIT